MAKSPICSIDGCDKAPKYAGLCRPHYDRRLRHGDPLAGRTYRGAARDFVDYAASFDGDECLFWPFSAVDGYGVLRWGGATQRVNRVICSILYGDPQPRDEAAHSCGNGHLGCCNGRHLRWASPSANAADKFLHGTQPCGAQLPMAKLGADAVREIRSLRGLESKSSLAARFGVTRSAIGHIQARRTWRSI